MTPEEEKDLNDALAELQKAAKLMKDLENAYSSADMNRIKEEAAWNLAGMLIKRIKRKLST